MHERYGAPPGALSHAAFRALGRQRARSVASTGGRPESVLEAWSRSPGTGGRTASSATTHSPHADLRRRRSGAMAERHEADLAADRRRPHETLPSTRSRSIPPAGPMYAGTGEGYSARDAAPAAAALQRHLCHARRRSEVATARIDGERRLPVGHAIEPESATRAALRCTRTGWGDRRAAVVDELLTRTSGAVSRFRCVPGRAETGCSLVRQLEQATVYRINAGSGGASVECHAGAGHGQHLARDRAVEPELIYASPPATIQGRRGTTSRPARGYRSSAAAPRPGSRASPIRITGMNTRWDQPYTRDAPGLQSDVRDGARRYTHMGGKTTSSRDPRPPGPVCGPRA